MQVLKNAQRTTIMINWLLALVWLAVFTGHLLNLFTSSFLSLQSENHLLSHYLTTI